MAYCSASDVYGYVQNLTDGEPDFTVDTRPPVAQIESWMSSGSSTINIKLSENGWVAPAASGTDLYGKLKDLNALYAAGRAELSRVGTIVSRGERTRGMIFLDMFNDELDELVKGDLDLIGGEVAINTSGGQIYVGGISEDDKDTYYDDSDRVQSRFRRNQFKFSESNYPDD